MIAPPVLLVILVTALVAQGFTAATLTFIVAPLSVAVALLWWRAYRHKAAFHVAPIRVLILALALWEIVHLAFAVVPAASLLALMQQGVLVLSFAAAAAACGQGPSWHRFSAGLGLVVLALCGWAVAQAVTGLPADASAGFVQRNSLSAWLMLAVFMLLPALNNALQEHGGRSAKSALPMVAITAALLVIFMSTSRGAMLALVVATLGLCLGLRRTHRHTVRVFLALMLVAFLAASAAWNGAPIRTIASFATVATLLGGADSMDGLIARVRDDEVSGAGVTRTSFSQRLVLWRGAAGVIPLVPWHGYGAGAFRLVYPPFGSAADRTNRDYAHNDLLQCYIELGLPGLMLVLALAIAVVLAWRAARSSAQLNEAEKLETSALFWGLAAIAGHSLVTYNFYVPAILVLCGIALARFERLGCAARGTRPAVPVTGLRPAVALPLLLLSAFAPTAVTATAARMTVHHERGVAALDRGELMAADSAFARAQRWYPNAQSETARAHVLLAAAAAANTRGERLRYVELAQRHIDAAARMDPLSPAVPHARYLVVVNSEFDLVARREAALAAHFAEALRRDPWYFPMRLEQARYQRRTSQVKAALDTLSDGLNRSFPRQPQVLEYFLLLRELRELMSDAAGVAAADAEIRRLRALLADTS